MQSPETWYNINGDFKSIFEDDTSVSSLTDTEYTGIDPTDLSRHHLIFRNIPYTSTKAGYVEVFRNNKWKIPLGVSSKFALLTEIKFKGDWNAAQSYVQFYLMGSKAPYIRVGCDYFKVISKDTQYGGTLTYPKPWKKETITDDHTKSIISIIQKYDDFIIVPDNKNYQAVIKNCYNLYSEFTHKPFNGPVTENDIPVTIGFLKHIFQEHFELGLIYMKVLYERPAQKLPILCLVSETNETGKTTFINFLEMIFGGNYVLVSPDDLTKGFNLSFATKNIIAAEEAFVEKSQGVEKLKSLSTGKSIIMSRKFIDDTSLPFYGKIVLCTNKVKDFMKINSKEIRFWVREVPVIQGKKNNLIEKQLFDEIPKFLKYLELRPEVDYNNGSRMILTDQQIKTDALALVKEESMSWLYKEIEILINDFFDNNPTIKSFLASSKDIKEEWFAHNNQVNIGFIKKVLSDEAGLQMKCSHSGKSIKYYRFGRDKEGSISKDYKTGTPYEFVRQGEAEPAEEAFVEKSDLPF